MKTAVSIPDYIFEEADELAKRMKKSRSELYSQAIREYVLRHSPDQITASLNQVLDDVGTDLDDLVRESAEAVLRRSLW